MRIPSSQSASIFGIVFGLILGVAGMACGIYFGVMKPAMDAGAPLVIPVRAILVISTILIFLVFLGVYIQRATCTRRPTDDKWEGGDRE